VVSKTHLKNRGRKRKRSEGNTNRQKGTILMGETVSDHWPLGARLRKGEDSLREKLKGGSRSG